MQIIGVPAPGAPAIFAYELPHGADPHRLAWEAGFKIVQPLSVSGTAPDLTLTALCAPHSSRVARPKFAKYYMEPNLPRVEPVRRQRVAAYAIVLSECGLLGTQFSERTAVPGMWGLPGGGIKPGETPSQAAVREVMEETGQALNVSQLLDLQSDHWVGRSPTGVVEDFHAVRVIYSGCAIPEQIVINDIGGTTSAAAWISLNAWRKIPWAGGAKTLLARHLPELVRRFREGRCAAVTLRTQTNTAQTNTAPRKAPDAA